MGLSKITLGYPVVISAGTTVAICTVTANNVGASKTTYVRSIVVFNNAIVTGETFGMAVQIYVVPGSGGVVGIATSGNRISRISLVPNNTFFFEPQYPITLSGLADSIQVFNEGTYNLGTATNPVNVIALGDRELG